MPCACGTASPEGARFCPGCGRPLDESAASAPTQASGSIATGAVIGEKYCVLQSLGIGGFGQVFRVRHLLLDREFALKALHPDLAANPRIRARFFREAKLVLDLQHPNLVTMREVGEWNGQLYMVMDLCTGQTLDAVLRERGRLTGAEAVPLAVQVLHALDYAHGRGIVHRDLKPPNLILEPVSDGHWEVKVLDFGVAKVLGEDELGPDFFALTARGTAVGTMRYMSPEQALGKPIDGRSDLYSLGAVLYHSLCGRVPYDHPDRATLVRQIVQDPPPGFPDPKIAAGMPGLESVIRRALAKSPVDRFSSAEEMLDAVLAAGAAAPGPARAAVPVPVKETPPPRRPPTSAIRVEPLKAPPQGGLSPLGWTLGLVAAAGLLCGLGWHLFLRGPDPGTGSRPPRTGGGGTGPTGGTGTTPTPTGGGSTSEDELAAARRREAMALLLAAQAAEQAGNWREVRRLVVQSLAIDPDQPAAQALHERALVGEAKEEAAGRAWSAARAVAEAALPTGELPAAEHPYGRALEAVDGFLAEHSSGDSATRARAWRAELVQREAQAVAAAVTAALEAAARLEQQGDLDEAQARLAKAAGFRDPRVDKASAALLEKRRRAEEAARLEEERRRREEEEARARAEAERRAAELRAAREKALLKAGYARTSGGDWLHQKSGITMVLIEPDAGEVRLGKPSRAYLLARTETTNGQFRRFRPGHASGQWNGVGLDATDHPVVNVHYSDAEDFCRWAGLRLPEAGELEYAATGGDRRMYPWGSTWPPPPNAGNWSVKGVSDGARAGARAGNYAASPLGVHDLVGNVSEWCVADRGMGLRPGVYGGSWHDDARECLRCDRVRGESVGTKEPWLGFRAAADVP